MASKRCLILAHFADQDRTSRMGKHVPRNTAHYSFEPSHPSAADCYDMASGGFSCSHYFCRRVPNCRDNFYVAEPPGNVFTGLPNNALGILELHFCGSCFDLHDPFIYPGIKGFRNIQGKGRRDNIQYPYFSIVIRYSAVWSINDLRDCRVILFR